MSGGHQGEVVANCPACWEEAYEPGWYAVLRATDGVIHLRADGRDDLLVQLPDGERCTAGGRLSHATGAGARRPRLHAAPGDR